MVTDDGYFIYYGIAIEFNYPYKTDYYLKESVFDTIEDALNECKEICNNEYKYFCSECGDALKPEICKNENNETVGVIITPKNGLDRWWYLAKILTIPLGLQFKEQKEEKNDRRNNVLDNKSR